MLGCICIMARGVEVPYLLNTWKVEGIPFSLRSPAMVQTIRGVISCFHSHSDDPCPNASQRQQEAQETLPQPARTRMQSPSLPLPPFQVSHIAR